MTYFEQLGVNYQYSARSISDAHKHFETSCDKCCTYGKHIDCDNCAIANVHHDMLLILAK